MLYRDWLNLKTHLLWCYDHVVYTAVRERRYRSSFEVNSGAWLVRSGWAEVQYGDEIVRAEPGQWLILRPGKRTQTMALNTHLLSISFEAVWPDGANWLEAGLPLVVRAKDHPALERKGKHLVGVMQMRKDAWDTRLQDVDALRFLKLERRLNEWLQVLLVVLDAHGIHPKERYGIDERVMATVRLLNEHPLGVKLDQKALATSVGLSVEHLTRLFHHDMHTSPRQYFEKRRLNHAKEQLRQPGIRIKEVAYNLGFTYLPHFSKWFKSTSGQTPRQYAKAMLGMRDES
jgi:AraC-like DNA-binding protein